MWVCCMEVVLFLCRPGVCKNVNFVGFVRDFVLVFYAVVSDGFRHSQVCELTKG